MATIKESFDNYWESFKERFDSLPLEKKKEMGTIILAKDEEGLHIGISGGSGTVEFLVACLLDCEAIKKETAMAAMKVALGVFDQKKDGNTKDDTSKDATRLFNDIIGKTKN